MNMLWQNMSTRKVPYCKHAALANTSAASCKHIMLTSSHTHAVHAEGGLQQRADIMEAKEIELFVALL